VTDIEDMSPNVLSRSQVLLHAVWRQRTWFALAAVLALVASVLSGPAMMTAADASPKSGETKASARAMERGQNWTSPSVVGDAEVPADETTAAPSPDPEPAPVPAPEATAPIPAPSAPALAGTGVDPTFQPAHDVRVAVGASIQQVLDAHPTGARVLLAAGVHRLTSPLRPRDRQQILGEPGAVLSGSKVVTGWVSAGGRWHVDDQTQRVPETPQNEYGLCDAGRMCARGERVFVDGAPLEQVPTVTEVGPGRFHFDYSRSRITVGDDPTGRRVEAVVAAQAFNGGGHDVTIRNLVVEQFGNRAQTGAVAANGARGWQVLNSEVRHNNGIGVFLHTGGVLRDSIVSHQGQMGVAANGQGVVIEHNEIAHNNVKGFNWYWEAGGSKFVWTDDLVVRGNWAHHNNGPGLWTDIDNINSLFEGNLAEHNAGPGIFHEISFDAVIRGNTARSNGHGHRMWSAEGAGILIANSRNVTVTANDVSANAAGIVLRNDNRGSSQRYGVPYVVENVAVTDNVIEMRSGFTGLGITNSDATRFAPAARIVFDRNTYRADLKAQRFDWQGMRDASGWRGFGHDVNGTFRDL
jgi:hypothetical protein